MDTNDNTERICAKCPRRFDHEDTGCQTFRSRALACRHGECLVRDRLYWRQLAEREGVR